MNEPQPDQHDRSDLPPVGQVTYILERDWLNPTGPFCIKRAEVVAHCDSREAARRWMLDNVCSPKVKP